MFRVARPDVGPASAFAVEKAMKISPDPLPEIDPLRASRFI